MIPVVQRCLAFALFVFTLPFAGDEADVFHTFFGIAGLSLLGSDGVLPVDPVHALPVNVMQRLRQQQS